MAKKTASPDAETQQEHQPLAEPLPKTEIMIAASEVLPVLNAAYEVLYMAGNTRMPSDHWMRENVCANAQRVQGPVYQLIKKLAPDQTPKSLQ